jgi:hypothetical protein
VVSLKGLSPLCPLVIFLLLLVVAVEAARLGGMVLVAGMAEIAA